MNLQELTQSLEKLRETWLLEFDGAGLDVMAEQHLLLALSALESAQRHAHLAELFQARALSSSRY